MFKNDCKRRIGENISHVCVGVESFIIDQKGKEKLKKLDKKVDKKTHDSVSLIRLLRQKEII